MGASNAHFSSNNYNIFLQKEILINLLIVHLNLIDLKVNILSFPWQYFKNCLLNLKFKICASMY